MNATEVAVPTSSYGYFPVRQRERPLPRPPLEKKCYFYKLESESSEVESDGNESVLTVQGKETDLAKDTSDTDWSSDESVVEYEVASSNEERGEDAASQIIDGDGSSDTENDLMASTLISIAMLSEGDFVSADSEDSNSTSSTDSEHNLVGYVNCAQCRNLNNNPMFRYCEKCYKVRKDFFPPRPKPKRPKSKKDKKQKHPDISNTDSSCLSTGTIFDKSNSLAKFDFKNIDFKSISVKGKNSNVASTSACLKDSVVSTESNARDTLDASKSNGNENPIRVNKKRSIMDSEDDDASKKRKRVDECDLSVIRKNVNKNFIDVDSYRVDSLLDLGVISEPVTSFSQPLFPTRTISDPSLKFSNDDLDLIRKVPSNFTDVEDNLLAESNVLKNKVSRQDSENSTNSESDKCITCLAEPKSGVFVHGRIAHICCCYSCSVKVWTKTKRCPICNCKVSNVLKAFVI